MECLFCRKPHSESYVCEQRCEARLSAIWAAPRKLHQMTIEECLPSCFANEKRQKGKKRPASTPTAYGKTVVLRILEKDYLFTHFVVDLTKEDSSTVEKTSDQEEPDRDEFVEPRKTRVVKLRNLTRRRCISCETVLSECTW